MQTINFEIEGVTPLIMHNARLIDPLNEWTKSLAEISKKRGKTEADYIEMGRREWFGSLYESEDGVPCVPGENLERMIRNAAALKKMGKVVQAAVIVPTDPPLIYDGSKNPELMWKSGKFTSRKPAKVGQSRVIRTRPTFRSWRLVFDVVFDETSINPDSVREFVEYAGVMVGLGDSRPKYGRFRVLKAEVV